MKVPFMSQELRRVAITVLKDVSGTGGNNPDNDSVLARTASVLRSTGIHSARKDSETEPVIFFSSPYLVLMNRAKLDRSGHGHGIMSLLQSFSGFDVGGEQRCSDMVRKMRLGSSKDEFHVPQLWSLLVGSGNES